MSKPGFLTRILTERERGQHLTAERVAGRWAAKEAVAKAMGRALRWHEVEIENQDSGAPRARLAEGLLTPGQRLHISISHVKDHAVAVAIVEREP